MIRAVIFDMNGVIISDELVHEMAYQKTLAPYGIKIDHRTYVEKCTGRTDRDCMLALSQVYKKDLPIEELIIQKSKYYMELFPENKRPVGGVIELVQELSKKFILGVCSSAVRVEVDMTLKEFDIFEFFKATISADDVAKGKPDPEPYLKTSQKLEVVARECAVIEDAKSGVKSAKAAGMKCIGITTTNSENEMLKSGADVVVDLLSEVVGVLEGFK